MEKCYFQFIPFYMLLITCRSMCIQTHLLINLTGCTKKYTKMSKSVIYWNKMFLQLIKFCPYTDVCIALYTQCFPSVCGKNFTGDSGGNRTHDLLLTSADILTSRPPSLLDRILAGLSSSGKLGGREVKMSALVSRRSWVRILSESPVKFFPQTLGKHWVYSTIHTSV